MTCGRAQAVECGLEDRLEKPRVAADFGDRGEHGEDLLQREVVSDLVGLLSGIQQRPPSGEDSGAIVSQDGVAGVGVLQQLGDD